MTRLRSNLKSGTLSASATSGATALSSANFANLPAIGATGSEDDYMVLTIEDEIVHVTAHTASATSVTVRRGMEGTTAAAHDSGVTWEHAPTVLDFDAAPPQFPGIVEAQSWEFNDPTDWDDFTNVFTMDTAGVLAANGAAYGGSSILDSWFLDSGTSAADRFGFRYHALASPVTAIPISVTMRCSVAAYSDDASFGIAFSNGINATSSQVDGLDLFYDVSAGEWLATRRTGTFASYAVNGTPFHVANVTAASGSDRAFTQPVDLMITWTSGQTCRTFISLDDGQTYQSIGSLSMGYNPTHLVLPISVHGGNSEIIAAVDHIRVFDHEVLNT